MGLMADEELEGEQQAKRKGQEVCQKHPAWAWRGSENAVVGAREVKNLETRQAEAGHTRKHSRGQARDMRRQESEAAGGGGGFAD